MAGGPTKNMYAVDTTKMPSNINQLLVFFAHTRTHTRQFYASFFSHKRKQNKQKRFCEILVETIYIWLQYLGGGLCIQ